MKPSRLAFATIALSLCCSFSGSAAILTYSETVTSSGTFDGTTFTNQLVTISITADTANIGSTGQSPNIWTLGGPLIVSVAGLGSTNFTNTGGIVVNNGQSGIFAGEIGTSTDVNAPAFLGIFNPAFQTYHLSTTFGPVTGTGNPPIFGAGGSTASGSLSLFNIGTVTFSVTAAAVVPEPAPLLPAGAALAMVVFGFGKKRRAKRSV